MKKERNTKRPMKAREAAEKLGKSRSWVCAHWSQDRADYEANSISRAQPWAALGISRATWYRRGKPDPQAQPQRESEHA